MARNLYFRLLLGLIISLPFVGKAQQCPTAAFSIGADTVCINQPIPITNTSVGASSYEWDFCGGSAVATPVSLPPYTLSQKLGYGQELVYDGTIWHSFIVNNNSNGVNALTRVDFGNGLDAAPTAYENITIPGLGSGFSIAIIKEDDGNWRGVVSLISGAGNGFIRLNFGTSLTNSPSYSAVEQITGATWVRGLQVIRENNNYFLVASGTQAIFIVNLGSSLANSITGASTLTYNSSGVSFSRFKLLKYCNSWVGIITSVQGAIYQIIFTNTINSIPTLTSINKGSMSNGSTFDVSFFNKADHYYSIIPVFGVGTYLLDFDNIFDTEPSVSPSPLLTNDKTLIGLVTAQSNNNTYVFSSTEDYSAPSVLLRGKMGTNCPVSATNNFSAQPTFSYTTAGKYNVSLYSSGSNQAKDSVVVVAGKVKFGIASSCNNPTFSFTDSSCIGATPATYLWDFGDGNTSSSINTTHTYSTEGQYIVSLRITDANGVQFQKQQPIRYQSTAPIADFTYTNPVCSGGENIFTDASISALDTVVVWHWDLGNNTTSNAKNATVIYSTPGNYNVTLTITTQNGCTSSITKPLTIVIGPTVKFGYENTCFGDTVAFTDSSFFSSGISYLQGSRLWSFGDNTTDTTQNPKHQFAEAKNYTVSLRISSTDGCVSTYTQNINILPLPEANFNVPSLIFPNISTVFTDISSSANQTITNWHWEFGDPSSGANNTSEQQNPVHIFSAPEVYTVTLTVTTNTGCSQTVTKLVEVLRSCPESNFSLSTNTTNISQNITATNNSLGATQFQWDLCAGDLNQMPLLEQAFSVSNTVQNISVLADKGRCYAFAPFSQDVSNNTWQRFDFGNSFRNNPNMVLLGNPPNGTTPNALNKPVCVRIFRQDTAIYGLAINAATGNLMRLTFSDSLESDIVNATPLFVSGITKPENIEIVQDRDSLFAFITCNTTQNNKLLARLSFGHSFLNSPTVTILDNPILQSNNSGALLGMSLIRECNTWYMLVVSNSGKIIRLNFGISLNRTPSFQNVTNQWLAGITDLVGDNTLIKVSLHKDLNYTYGIGITKKGMMVTFKLNSVADNPIGKQVHSNNMLSLYQANIVDAQFINVGSEWHGFASLNNSTLGILKWSFPNPCSLNQPIRHGATINDFAYTEAGKYYVTLTSSDVRGWKKIYADSITINQTDSPELSYTCPELTVNIPSVICANQNINPTANTDTTNKIEWNMCAGDLSGNTLFESAFPKPNIYDSKGISLVKSNGEIYGLIASNSNSNPIIFARFGSSLNSAVSLFNYPINSYYSCNDTKLVNDNGRWVGFLSNISYINSSANQIIRLNWNGEPLSSNTPSISSISGKGLLYTPDGLETAEENGQKYLFVVNNAAQKTIVVYNFGNSYLNTPSISSFRVDSAVSIQRISMIKDCNRWYGVVSDAQGGAIIKLDFNKGLNRKPTLSRIFIGTNKYPTSLKLWRDNGKFYAIVASFYNNINNHFKVNFGNKMSNNVISVTDMGTNNDQANYMSDFDMIATENSEVKMVGISPSNGGTFYQFKFPNPCATTSPIVENTTTPLAFNYTQNGSYNISVTITDTNNNSYSISQPIEVKNPVSADFNQSGIFCKGETISFTNTSITEPNTPPLNYAWDFGDPTSIDNTATTKNTSHIFVEAGTYTVNLYVTTGSGCGSSKQKTVRIYNPPQANFSVENPSIGLCANDSISFTNESTCDVGDQISGFNWIIKDANANILFTSSEKNPKFLFDNIGVYTVMLTVIAKGNCPNTITKTVDITNLGAAVTIGGSSEICEGSPITYTANVNSADITNVFWNLGDNQTSTDMNPTVAYTSAGARTITLQITNTVGCTSTISKNIMIYSRPTANINTNTAACRNSPLVLSATSSISEGLITSYHWSFGDGTPDQMAAVVSHIYTSIGIYNVRLIITTQYGCKDTSEVVISVAPAPTAAFIAKDTCVGKPIYFKNQSSSIAGALTYMWQFRNTANTVDLGTSTLQNPTFTFTNAGIYPVILTVQDGQCSNTIAKNIVISGTPQASISIEEGCVGTPFTFHDNTTYSTDTPVAWFWTITQNSQILQTMTTPNPQLLLPVGTGYSVQLKVFTQKGCEATSPTLTFPVAAPPVANFSIQTTTFTGAPFNVSFQNTSTNAISYSWDFGDGITSTETNPIHTYAAEGLYMVTLKAIRNACSDTATHSAGVFVNITKGIKLSNLSVSGTELLTIAARIQNESNVELNTLSMKAQTSDGLAIEEIWTGSLLPNASLVYTFGAKLYVRNSNVVPFVCAETQLLNPSQEITPENNSTCQVLSSSSFLLAVSPIPANKTLNIRYLVAQANEVTIELIDMLGKKVFVDKKGNMLAGKYEQSIDLEQMTTGMYYLRLIVGKQKVNEKISVQH